MNQPILVRDPDGHPPARPRRASLLWLLGASLLAYSIAIAATGGVDVTVAGVRVRSRTWQRPAVLGGLCLLAVAVTDRRRALSVARHITRSAARRLDRAWPAVSPRVVAMAATAWTLGAGLAFSTCVAGGADSSGYLNQARLFARGRLLDDTRLDARPPAREPAWTVAPLGYRPARDGERLAPTYPPGYPLLMAAGFLVQERAAFLVVPICGALAVWLTFAIGARLGEGGAGAAAALLLSVSPTFLHQLVQPMSDVPATAAWLLALATAMRPTGSSAALAGAAAGAAILIRPNLAPLAALAWSICALADGSQAKWRRAAIAVSGTLPAIVALGYIQEVRYGSPWSSGYGPTSQLFAWANVGPNLDRYPRWLVETHTPLIALFVLAPLWMFRARVPLRRLFMTLWLFAVAVPLAYLPYVYFQEWEWTYTRFLLPAIPVMWFLTFTPIARLLRNARPALTAALAVPVLLALTIFSLVVSARGFVFELRDGERKYVSAADYVRRALPPNAVLISMQHSGSLWYYTRRPVFRWDDIEPRRLDETIDWSTAHGYAPAFVVDAEEFERVKERFGPAGQRSLGRVRQVARFGDAVIYEVD